MFAFENVTSKCTGNYPVCCKVMNSSSTLFATLWLGISQSILKEETKKFKMINVKNPNNYFGAYRLLAEKAYSRLRNIILLNSFINKLMLTNVSSSSSNTSGMSSVMRDPVNLVEDSSGNVVSSSHSAILISARSTNVIDEVG